MENKINLLSFHSCREKECNCGCNLHLGMDSKNFIKFWKFNYKGGVSKKI